MTEIHFDYRPLPIHEPFHRSLAPERCLFGAFGSGKTYALCAEAIALGLEQPGSRILITRKTIPELRDTTETVFMDILPVELFNASKVSRIGGHYEKLILPNGSVFLFRGIDDWQKHKSLNVCAIFYDEADEFDEETITGMASRVRQRDITREAKAAGYTNEVTRRFTAFAANPAGHNWLYHRFVDQKTARPRSAWFKSTSFDNAFLPVDYLEQLLSYPEPWIKRYVLCQFDDFAGQIYEDWTWDDHVIREPLEGWAKGSAFWMGMDPGTRSPTAGLWVVLDTANRRLVGIDEYEDNYMAASKHAKAWRQIEAKHKMNVNWRVADPIVTTKDRGTNMGLDTQYRRLGFNFALGPRTHADRIPMLGGLITARQFVVTERCMRTYEAIKNYKWEDLTPTQRAKGIDPPDKPLKRNDHLVDCAQYLSSRWVKPLHIPSPRENLTPAQELARDTTAAIRKQIGKSRRAAKAPRSGTIV